MSTPDTLPTTQRIETENLHSMPAHLRPGAERITPPKGGQRDGAGAKALPPELKMQAFKINALPRDWEYLQLFIPADVDKEQRTPSHLFRAGVERLRLHCPYGPDKSFYTADPETPARPRTTPAVAREAAQRGISKAALINEMYLLYKREKARED